MNKINVLSLPFYEFTADEELTNDVLEDVKKLKFDMPNTGNKTSYGNDFYYHPKLFDFFDKCLLELKLILKLKETLELPIVSCWVNKNSKLQYHHYHNHFNSIISGIFYLTTHDSGNTVFAIPDPWYNNLSDPKMPLSTNTGVSYGELLPQLSGKNKPISGKLILFPSHIKHKVLPLTSNDDRYTIAFNTFISGVLGEDNHSIYLNLKAKSVREIVEKNKT